MLKSVWWWCNFISCKFQTFFLYVLWVNWSSRCFDCLYASAMEIRRLNFELYSSISAVCQRAKAEYEVTLRQRRLHTASTLGAPQTLKWNRPCWSNSDTLCHRCLYGGQLALSARCQRANIIFEHTTEEARDFSSCKLKKKSASAAIGSYSSGDSWLCCREWVYLISLGSLGTAAVILRSATSTQIRESVTNQFFIIIISIALWWFNFS